MTANALKSNSALRIGRLTSDPSSPENGLLYYNSTSNKFKLYVNGVWDQIASEGYANALAAGFDPKQSVKAVTTGVLPNTPIYNNGASGVGATLTSATNTTLAAQDGVTLALNDRLLVKDQVGTAVAEVTQFTFSQTGSFYDVVGAGKALQLFNAPAVGHYFWFNVTDGANSQTDPALTGTGHQVDILTADTAAQVATKFFTEVALVVAAFTATNPSSGVAVVTNVTTGHVTDATASGTAAAISVTTQGVSTGFTNGIYYLSQVGSGAAPWILTRATDFDGSPANEIDGGEYVFVLGGGTLYGATNWIVVSPAGSSATIGTSAITWSQIAGSGSLQAAYSAGNTINTNGGDGNVIITGTEGVEITNTSTTDATLHIVQSGAANTNNALWVENAGVSPTVVFDATDLTNTNVAFQFNNAGLGTGMLLQQTNTSGAALSINLADNTNLSNTIDISNGGLGRALDITTTITGNAQDSIFVTHNATAGGSGIRVTNSGAGYGLYINGTSGSAAGVFVQQDSGAGAALSLQLASGNTNPVIILDNGDGTGSEIVTPNESAGNSSKPLRIQSGDASGTGATGDISIFSASPTGTGNSGGMFFLSGDVTAAAAVSGAITLKTGDSSDSSSGAVTISSGDTVNAGSGAMSFYSGISTTTGNSGSIDIYSSAVGTGDTGYLTLSTGIPADGNSGNITLASGNGGTNGSSGNISVTVGTAPGTGNGGFVAINAGPVTGTGATGGALDLYAGNGGTGTDCSGGTVTIGAGNGVGTGTSGNVILNAGAGGASNGVVQLSANNNAFVVRSDAVVDYGDGTSEAVSRKHVYATLADATGPTAVAGFTFAHASNKGMLIDYVITEATTLASRAGRILVATNGTITSITDTYTETSDPGVTWTSAVSGANVEVRYTTTSTGNTRSLKAESKKFNS